MAYMALYREWRPQTFTDIVGQNHVSQTLQNAIKTERVAHAYLFCGPRGTGKTTSAKVLAKALNCVKGPSENPCNECENCLRINQGSSMDVLEIDAASNRGIDEIRDLKEKINFAPSEGKYKVYIIDEVHMLTNEAFNALLKTLEEPPKHVVFVLATTEPHKIPLTILSRCQRFDFKRIGLEDIEARLSLIAKEKGLDISDEAIFLIAKVAEGGMRDALSILDQSMAYGGDRVDVEVVHSVVGTISGEKVALLFKSIVDADISAGLGLLSNLVSEGKDLKQLLRDLIDYCRDLLLAQVCVNLEEVLKSSLSLIPYLKDQATKLSEEQILKTITIFTEAEQSMRWSSQPKLLVEVAIIKASQITRDFGFDKIVKRLEVLEDKLANGNFEMPVNTKTNVPTAKKVVPVRTKVVLGENNQALLASITGVWPRVLETIKTKRRTIHAFLLEGTPYHVEGQVLTILFKKGYTFHRDNVEKTGNVEMLQQVIQRESGEAFQLRCLLEDEIAGKNTNEEKNTSLVDDAINIFGSDVIEIKKN